MHHGIEYFPFKDGKYPVIFPNFQIFLHYDKSLRSKFDSRRESGLLLPQKKGHICLFMNSYHKFKTLTLSLKVDKHSIVHFARKYLPIFVLEHYLFHKAHSFLLELRTWFGTVNGRGQNSEHTFGPKGGSIRSQMTPKCG